MGGSIHDGPSAVRAGLATHCASTPESLAHECSALVGNLLSKGPVAMRATKRWVNELDGSNDATRFHHAAEASAAAAEGTSFQPCLVISGRSATTRRRSRLSDVVSGHIPATLHAQDLPGKIICQCACSKAKEVRCQPLIAKRLFHHHQV